MPRSKKARWPSREGAAVIGLGVKPCVRTGYGTENSTPAPARAMPSAGMGAGMSASRTVATIRKNNSEEIRVGLVEHGGFAMIDLRVFAAPRGGQDEPRPTKNGICIPHTQLPSLIEALRTAEREASR